jgi:hypothetical protein
MSEKVDQVYGYWSETQYKHNKQFYVYLTATGTEVHVTEVSYNQNSHSYLNDRKFVGMVAKFAFVREVHVPWIQLHEQWIQMSPG